MRKNKIRILHVAQAAGGVDRYIRMLLKYLDKEKFENILVCSQDFHEEDKPIIIHTIEYFENHPMIDAIALVCVADWIDYCKSLLYKFRIRLAAEICAASNPRFVI